MILKKIFFKLMKNTVFGKTIDIFLENIKLVTTDRRRNYLVSEPNYHTTNFFTKNASAIEMKKTKKQTEMLM